MRKNRSRVKTLTKNKRGAAEDIFFVLALLLLFSIGILVIHYGYNEISPILRQKFAEPGIADNFNETIQETMIKGEEASDIFDYIFVMLFFGLFLGMMLTAYLVDVHPAFISLFLIAAVIAIAISFPLSNAFIRFNNDSPANMASSFAALPMTVHIMGNLPLYAIGLTITFIVVLYAKTRRTDGF